jgi:2-C-methyl-D-erythritol 4-phosphate cytidylyltransferase
MSNIALLMMGGTGNRTKSPIPKQFIEINGKPIFLYILEGLDKLDCIDSVIVVVHKDWVEYSKKYTNDIKKLYSVTEGGESRSESVLNGLEKAKEFAKDDDVVMMFDSTHPYVDEKGIEELISAVKTYGGATLGQRQYDTCYVVDKEDMLTKVMPRQEIVSGASPEGFLFKTIYDIYKNASSEELNSMTSAGAIALAHNVKMKVCTLNTINLKITYPQDIDILQKMFGLYFGDK